MHRGKTPFLLFFIVLISLGSAFVVFWPGHGKDGKAFLGIPNNTAFKEGLDLQGGIQVLLMPDAGQNTSPEVMQTTRTQIEQRVNSGLSVNEPDIRLLYSDGQPGISVELPGLNDGNQQEVLNTLQKTEKLEFWDTGSIAPPENTQFDPSQYKQTIPDEKTALFTGADLDPNSLNVGQDQQIPGYAINFTMKGAAFGKLSSYTASHIGDHLTITLDRKVVSSPQIQAQLPGTGLIQGNFTLDQATKLMNVLKYGALPISLHIESQQTIGATLGQDSLNRCLLAGEIGIGVVILFMLLYYRLPGFLADCALLLYAMFTLAVFKLTGVTLTLTGIAGFILSIGMAVDANILIFERVKEELRAGRLLQAAIDVGWKRAWPSIRDSNISTLITCAVLYGFGSNFGATLMVGFATTLFIGVIISMFTAVIVTRTFLNLLVPTGVINHPTLFGLPADSVVTTFGDGKRSRIEGSTLRPK